MRIATWNVWHRFGDWEARAEAILAVLRDVDADVVCLQEVWTAGERSQAAELADALGLGGGAVDAHRVDHEGVTFGNAVLSRWPITHSEVRPLTPHPTYEEYRTILGVEIAAPFGQVPVFTTHLNFLLDQSAVRQVQVRDIARMVLDWRSRRQAHPPVVTGDFNAEPASDEIRQLTGLADLGLPLALYDAWRIRGKDIGPTWSRSNPLTRDAYEPDRRIDYVLVGGARDHGGVGAVEACLRFGTESVDGVWASDHFGVVADLAPMGGRVVTPRR